ncbi:MAG: cysteine synthase family protein [Candidatus Bathyarchaeota archaeon]|nr:MAG: cysteine synthase family protein [Candidatus Bathyarchaeota archaeon]
MKSRVSVLDAIGNTPLVRLNKITKDLTSEIFVKLEYYNPTGSYKDRMAYAMIDEAEKEGKLKQGYTVIEYTGGSTGSSLAFVCAIKGYKLKIVSSDAFSQEKIKTMKAFGAEVIIVPSEEHRITPDLVPRMIEKARQLASKPNTYWTNQLYNHHQLKGHNKMGKEILAQTNDLVDAFVASVGSAGCAMGVSEVLKARNRNIRVVVVEPAESPMISKGQAGEHHIEGIGAGFIPPLLRKDLYDEVIVVKEKDAKQMARRLAREEGVFSGTSTGANVVASIELAKKSKNRSKIVTVAVDTGLKYLLTEPYRELVL